MFWPSPPGEPAAGAPLLPHVTQPWWENARILRYFPFTCTLQDLVWQKMLWLCNCVNDLWFLSSSPCDSDAPDLITWPLSLLSSCKFTRVTDFCVNSIVAGGLIFEGGVKWRFHCAYLHVELGAALSKHGCCTYFIMAGAPCFDRHREHYAFFTFLYHTSLRSALVLIDQSAYFK